MHRYYQLFAWNGDGQRERERSRATFNFSTTTAIVPFRAESRQIYDVSLYTAGKPELSHGDQSPEKRVGPAFIREQLPGSRTIDGPRNIRIMLGRSSLPFPRLHAYIQVYIYRGILEIPTYLYFQVKKDFIVKKRRRENGKMNPLFNASNNIGKITFNDYPRYHEKFNKGKGRKFLVTR